MELVYFTAVDYVILAIVLATSVAIGIYHGIKGNRTTEEFLLANRSLSPVPVACSLIVSFLSSVSILGYTAEAYGYGLLQMFWMIPGFVCALLVNIHVIIPVFYGLQMKSINEYMILRFKSPLLKYMMLMLSCLHQLLLLGIMLYAPTLAMAAVTPISSDTYIVITGAVVTLYCSIGGIKAVVWTDLFQMIVLISGVVVITSSAVSKAGGLASTWQIAHENGRLDVFNMSLGLYERHTAINTFILGMTSYGYVFSFSQASIQRITTQRSVRHAQGVMYVNLIGMSITLTIIFLGGIGIYAVYHGCDPITLGLIEKRDQIMPLYVMQHLHFLTGVPGLFIACLFSGTLSSISSLLNAVPTMLWNDLIAELQYFQKASEGAKTIFNKLLTVALGAVMIGLAFLASKTQGVVQAIHTVSAVVGGPFMGVFLIGIGMPFVGKKGAITGCLASMCVMAWIGIGAQFYGEAAPMLPFHSNLCQNLSTSLASNSTMAESLSLSPASEKWHPLWFLYNISYTYFCLIGISVCVGVSIVASFITGCEKLANVKPEHVIRFWRRRVGASDGEDPTELESFLRNPPAQPKFVEEHVHCYK